MLDYKKAKIFKIECNVKGYKIVTSICEGTIEKRMKSIENKYKSYKKGQCEFQKIFDAIKENNYKITFLEDFPCDNKKELEDRENYHSNLIQESVRSTPPRGFINYRQYVEDLKEQEKYYSNLIQETLMSKYPEKVLMMLN